jgi:hypothetical protein
MKKNKFYFIIILILIIIIFLQKCIGDGLGRKDKTIHDTITTIDTSYITITKEIPKYTPKWNIKIQYTHDTIKVIDTAYVIGDYYSTYVYKDSLITDTLKVYINDSISQNKIKIRDIKYKITLPIVTITNNITKRRNEFYYGFNIAGEKSGINSFGPELMLKTKNSSAYGIGVGLNRNFQPIISFKMYWKIGKK